MLAIEVAASRWVLAVKLLYAPYPRLVEFADRHCFKVEVQSQCNSYIANSEMKALW